MLAALRPRPRAVTAAMIATLTAAIFAACGGGEGVEPAERTPADAVLYGQAVVQPEGDLKQTIEDLLGRFPGGDQTDEALIAALEEDAETEGFSFEEDIEPWLGEQVAGFGAAGEGGEVAGAALVEATDEGAARDFVEKAAEADELEETERDYQGVELLVDEEGTAVGVFDGLLAVGEEAAVERAIDTREDDALAGEDRYAEAVDRTEADSRLGLALIDLQGLFESLPAEETEGFSPDQFLGLLQDSGTDPAVPVVISAAVGEGVVRFEQTSSGEGIEGGADLLGTLPADSVLAYAVPELPPGFVEGLEFGFSQGAAEEGVDQQELERALERELGVNPIEALQSLEAFGLYVRGGAPTPGGAAFADLASERDAADVVAAVRRAVTREGTPVEPLPRGAAGAGFTIPPGAVPFPLIVAQDEARLVVATSAEELDAATDGADETLEESGAI
ncbi:MAG TPA: DUF3352 domain-containing protein, partial [Thermoleophilaceae bacterium]|nr:DUF3352 domain-containing protein [Thermoleophilaceae bacterium]